MTTLFFLVGFLALLALGLPIAWAMLASSAFYLFSADLPSLQLTLKTANGVDHFTLLAIPMFLLAGNLMNAFGATQRIFRFAEVLVRHVSGGLGHVNVVASVIFAGMSGSVVADAGGLGAVEIQAMRRAGYCDRFSAAVTAASATVGPVIPPSITMVVYGFLAEASVGRLFLAGAIPGLLVASCLMVLIYIMAKRSPETFPAMPRASLQEVGEAFRAAFLPLMAPVLLLAGILTGVFTPTEGSVVMVLYIVLIGVLGLGGERRGLVEAFGETIRASANSLFIIAVSMIFGWIITIERLPSTLVSVLSADISSRWLIIAMMLAVLLFLGTFLEVIAALILIVPTFLPLATTFGIDPIHLGVLVVMAMMVGTITPPVGLALFAVMTVSGMKMGEIVRGLWPFYIAVLIAVVLIAFVPGISLWLPDLVLGARS